VLIPSKDEDPPERIRFGEGLQLTVSGRGAALLLANERLYMAIALPPAAARSASCLA